MNTRTPSRWKITDRSTGRVYSRSSSRAAYRLADRLDHAYGAVCAMVQPLFTEA